MTCSRHSKFWREKTNYHCGCLWRHFNWWPSYISDDNYPHSWCFYTLRTCGLQTCHTHLHIARCQLSRWRLTELWMFQEARIGFLMLNNRSRVLETCFMVFLTSQCVEIWKGFMGCPLCVFNENWPSYGGTALSNKTCRGWQTEFHFDELKNACEFRGILNDWSYESR